MAKKCQGKNSKGKPCQAYAVEDSKLCVWHDPTYASRRKAWATAGGLARKKPEGKPAELMSVEDIRQGLAATIGSTWELSNTGERSRALCSLYVAALRTFEATEIEDRMVQLEERLDELAITFREGVA